MLGDAKFIKAYKKTEWRQHEKAIDTQFFIIIVLSFHFNAPDAGRNILKNNGARTKTCNKAFKATGNNRLFFFIQASFLLRFNSIVMRLEE